jgi:hypothetical protein
MVQFGAIWEVSSGATVAVLSSPVSWRAIARGSIGGMCP